MFPLTIRGQLADWITSKKPIDMFPRTIFKEDVIAYFSKNGDEEEILAVVGDNFEKIY